MAAEPITARWTPERIAFAGALVLRLLFLLTFRDNPLFLPVTGGSDRSLYDQLAQRVAAGGIWPTGVFQYMPLYAWILGFLYKIGGASNFVLAAIFGMLCDACSCALIVRLARRLGAAAWAAVLGAGLYAAYPLAVVYSVMTMPNTLNALMVLAFADRVDAYKARGDSNWPGWAGVGILAGLTCLSFAGMLLILAVVIPTVCAVRYRKRLGLLSPVLSMVLLPAMLILPVTLHNRRAEPGFVLITAHGGFNFWMGNHEGATGYPMQIEGFRGDRGSLLVDAWADAERREGRTLTSAEFNRHWSNRAWDYLRAHPGDGLRLAGLKFLRFVSATEYDDLRLLPMISLTGTWLGWPIWPGFALLGWLGLVGVFALQGAGVPRAVLLAGAAGVVLFFVTARYRLTLAPLLAVFAAGALTSAASVVGGRRIRMAAGLVVSGLFVWWPLPQSDFRALDHYNAATHLLDRGLATEAAAMAVRGLELAPQEADLHFVLGNARVGLGDWAAAEASYREAIRLRPRHAQALFNLAVALQAQNRTQDARVMARQALEVDPQLLMAAEFLKNLPDGDRR